MGGNIDGGGSTATGILAFNANLHGSLNTATGIAALQNNAASNNTAMAAGALNQVTIGSNNTAVGLNALHGDVIGGGNTAVGTGALEHATAGFNTAVGVDAGSAVTTATNVIAIGYPGADVTSSCFIGNIRGVTTDVADAIPVLIDSASQLGAASSSQRFKKDIKPMESSSDSILNLKPVTFHYKSDRSNTPQFGLIAEEVAKVNPDLVVHDKDGQVYTVRYDAVNAMLLNEFLKEHKKVQNLEVTVAQQQKGMEVLTAQLKEQAAQIQKVNAQLEVNKRAPNVVANKP
jgi:Chaperone of endosialidase